MRVCVCYRSKTQSSVNEKPTQGDGIHNNFQVNTATSSGWWSEREKERERELFTIKVPLYIVQLGVYIDLQCLIKKKTICVAEVISPQTDTTDAFHPPPTQLSATESTPPPGKGSDKHKKIKLLTRIIYKWITTTTTITMAVATTNK